MWDRSTHPTACHRREIRHDRRTRRHRRRVTITIVCPNSSTARGMNAKQVRHLDFEPRFPDGSSAKMISGRRCEGAPRHTLLLPAGQFAGAMRQPVAQSTVSDHGVEPCRIGIASGDIDRKRMVFGGIEGWNQVERLEDEPDLLAAGQVSAFSERSPRGTSPMYTRPPVSESRPATQWRSVLLPGPEGPMTAVNLPRSNESEFVQRSDPGVSLAVDLGTRSRLWQHVHDSTPRRLTKSKFTRPPTSLRRQPLRRRRFADPPPRGSHEKNQRASSAPPLPDRHHREVFEAEGASPCRKREACSMQRAAPVGVRQEGEVLSGWCLEPGAYLSAGNTPLRTASNESPPDCVGEVADEMDGPACGRRQSFRPPLPEFRRSSGR